MRKDYLPFVSFRFKWQVVINFTLIREVSNLSDCACTFWFFLQVWLVFSFYLFWFGQFFALIFLTKLISIWNAWVRILLYLWHNGFLSNFIALIFCYWSIWNIFILVTVVILPFFFGRLFKFFRRIVFLWLVHHILI